MRRPRTIPLVLLLLAPACDIERAGSGADLAPATDAGRSSTDAGTEGSDARPIEGADAGRTPDAALPPRDAGGCPPGSYDLDRLPGCEYLCTPAPDLIEICNDRDDDCDGQIDNLALVPRTRFFRDADGDGYGTIAMTTEAYCHPPPGFATDAGDCNDAVATIHPGAAETCNAGDDDCNGVRDDGATCPCALVHSAPPASAPYLFCTTRRNWLEAEAACVALGYHLATVDSEPENAFVYTTARAALPESWWIGYNDRGTEDRWDWIGGGAATGYSRWHTGEPNDGDSMSADEDCGTAAAYASGDPTWNDAPCEWTLPSVCEVTR